MAKHETLSDIESSLRERIGVDQANITMFSVEPEHARRYRLFLLLAPFLLVIKTVGWFGLIYWWSEIHPDPITKMMTVVAGFLGPFATNMFAVWVPFGLWSHPEKRTSGSKQIWPLVVGFKGDGILSSEFGILWSLFATPQFLFAALFFLRAKAIIVAGLPKDPFNGALGAMARKWDIDAEAVNAMIEEVNNGNLDQVHVLKVVDDLKRDKEYILGLLEKRAAEVQEISAQQASQTQQAEARLITKDALKQLEVIRQHRRDFDNFTKYEQAIKEVDKIASGE